MNLSSVSILLFSFGVLLIALLALVKRKDIIAIRFLAFSISVFGWGFPTAFWLTQLYSESTSVWLMRLAHSFAVFIPITWLHFVFDFINRRKSGRFLYLVNYGIAFFLLVFSQDPLFIKGARSILEFKYFTSPGPLYLLYVGSFFTLVPYAFYHLLQAYQSSVGQARAQLKYLILGTVVGFTAGSTLFLGVYGIPFPLVFLVLMPLYPFFTGVALIRYGLFDYQQIADAFQREKMAAIGTMAASLNHELRNPLFIAKGKIESHIDALHRNLYDISADREKINETVLETALHQLTRAMDIMQRFSDFAKPFGARMDKERIGLKQLFDNVLQLVSNEFQMQKVRLNEQSMDGLTVFANRRQLEEVFFNLIVNACHAMGEDGGELSIKAAQPNGKVIVEISDTGPGIAKESVRRIFEPFYSTKGEKGSGLGLYITKQLVDRNGGKISVKSKPGEGTTFTLEFKR